MHKEFVPPRHHELLTTGWVWSCHASLSCRTLVISWWGHDSKQSRWSFKQRYDYYLMRHIAKPQRRFVIHTAAIVTWLLSSISLSSHLLSILIRQIVTSIFTRSTHCASKHEDTNSKREDSKTLNPEGAGIICTRASRGSVSRTSTSVCIRKY